MSPSKLGLFLIAAGLAAACTDEDNSRPRRATIDDASVDETDASAPDIRYWVGDVEDSDIRLGVAQELDADRARVFFCGGPSSYATSTRWVVLPLAADGGGDYDEDGWKIEGKFSGDTFRGTLQVPDQASREFQAAPVRKGTIAGLYEGLAPCGRVGLIVAQPRAADDPSGQGACVGAGHPPEQVNPILPIALDDGEIRVKVGGEESRVKPAGGPPAP